MDHLKNITVEDEAPRVVSPFSCDVMSINGSGSSLRNPSLYIQAKASHTFRGQKFDKAKPATKFKNDLFKAQSLKALLASGCAIITSFAVSNNALAQDDIDLKVTGKVSTAIGIDDQGDFAGDVNAQVKVKGSKILDNGLEVGAVVEARYDEDQPRRGFGAGRLTGLLNGGPRGVGPLSGDVFVQGAYGYARGGFGKVVVGRDKGVARQLSVTAPTIFDAINLNDYQSDLSGLNDIHTVNDFSGYATKISYLPPANLLGGVVGGLQLGVSYSPKLSECGEDLCGPQDDRFNISEASLLTESSRWEDVLEGAFFYQKGLDFGSDGQKDITVGFGASVVTASENTAIPGVATFFDDYQAYSLGLNVAFRGLTLGGSVKSTNAGIRLPDEQDDDYFAFDAGVTYKTGDWAFLLGYGKSEANLVGATINEPTLARDTQTAQAGVTYFLGRGITIGAAAQYIEAKDNASSIRQEDSVTAVIETGIRF